MSALAGADVPHGWLVRDGRRRELVPARGCHFREAGRSLDALRGQRRRGAAVRPRGLLGGLCAGLAYFSAGADVLTGMR
jgi:hypothetical protein